VVARNDSLSIDLDSGNASWLGSRGDDDFLARRDRLLLSLGDLNRAFARKATAAFDPIDFVLLEQEPDPVGQPFDDPIFSRLDLIHVEPDGRIAKRKAPLVPILGNLQRMRMFKQSFRRNAAP